MTMTKVCTSQNNVPYAGYPESTLRRYRRELAFVLGKREVPKADRLLAGLRKLSATTPYTLAFWTAQAVPFAKEGHQTDAILTLLQEMNL